MDALLMTPEQAATALAIGRSKVYELIRDRRLRSLRIGNCRRIPTAALLEFIDQQTVNGRVVHSPTPDPQPARRLLS